MAQVLSPRPHTTITSPCRPKIDLSWSDRDAAALLSVNIPLQPHRIAQTHTKPHSTRSRRSIVAAQLAHHESHTLRRRQPHDIKHECGKGGTIESPRKVVKKLCLDTTFGPEWRITDWDRARAVHMRKQAHQRKNDTTFDDSAVTADVSIGESVHVSEAPLVCEPSDSLTSNNSVKHDSMTNDEASVKLDPAVATPQINEPTEDMAPRTLHSEELALEGMSDNISPTSAETPCESDSHHLASTALTTQDQTQLSPAQQSVAGSEDTARPTPPKHRMSDDKANLEAFLRRAGENKRPMTRAALRDSLENRRDSGAVRLAMASPARLQVLKELDANSPLLPRSDDTSKGSTDHVCDVGKLTGSPGKTKPIESTSKSVRRSSRSRSRQELKKEEPAAPLETPRIAFHGAARPVALRATRSGHDGTLAAETRANTKMNKGNAVMPSERLVNIDVTESGVDSDQSGRGIDSARSKSVSWKTVLVTFEDGAAPVQDTLTSESPLKAGRGNSTHQGGRENVKDNEEGNGQLPVEPASNSKTGSGTRRSRIATPARGLTSRAARSTPGPVAARTSVSTSTPATKTHASTKKRRGAAITAPGLSTSRKIDFVKHSPPQVSKPDVETEAARVGAETNPIASPLKLAQPTAQAKAALLAPPTIAIALSPSLSPATSFKHSVNTGNPELNSLSSPPKRRVRRPLTKDQASDNDAPAQILSLASPAKRPIRRHVPGHPDASPMPAMVLPSLASPAKRPNRNLFKNLGSPDSQSSFARSHSAVSVLSLSSPAKRPARGRLL